MDRGMVFCRLPSKREEILIQQTENLIAKKYPVVYGGGQEILKFSELMDKDVFVENKKIAKIKNAVIDTDEWKVTHLVIELTKEAAEEILGATPALTRTVLNTLAISALEKGTACCSDTGVDIRVSKKQIHMYLRPI